jgi:hypothetical protein
MKRVLRGTVIGVVALVILLCGLYLILGMYYMVGFPCFTWINGVYCTGKTVYEVNQELVGDNPYDGIAVIDKSGARLFVSAKDAGMSIDYTQALEEVFYNRNSFAWGAYVFDNLSRQYDPVISIDRDKVDNIISSWEIFIDPSDFECSIVRTADGYSLENTSVSVPDRDVITKRVYDAMCQRQPVIDLAAFDNCYREFDLRSGSEDKIALFHNLDKLQHINVDYHLGDEVISLTGGRFCDFILTGKDLNEALGEEQDRRKPGSGLFIIGGRETSFPAKEDLSVVEGILVTKDYEPIISESRMYAFFKDITDRYDTSWMLDNYRKGLGETVIVNGSQRGDGTIFDVNAEFNYLKTELLKGEEPESERAFELSRNAKAYNAKNVLGQTYIEVNMDKQMLYYYVDGELSMDMPVVTGNINRSRGTPSGIYPVYNKRYHTYLRGVDYVSYVNYWLGVNKGVGIHDATWRKKFGEEIYKSDGSHGCINCPLGSVEALWDVVEIGTPVILYY